jgi:hypothetical protein
VGGIVSTLKALFGMVAGIFGYARDRSKLKNAPDVRAAEVGRQEQAEKDKVNKAIAENDEDEIKKRLSE